MNIKIFYNIYKNLTECLLLTCFCIILCGFNNHLDAGDPHKKSFASIRSNITPNLGTDLILKDSIGLDTSPAELQVPLLTKPRPLLLISITDPSLLPSLDKLISKKTVSIIPYVPIIQEISIGIESISLLRNTWSLLKNITSKNPHIPYAYMGSVGILFRGNIQLSTYGGYTKIFPETSLSIKKIYNVTGFYGGVGLDYFTRYSVTDNLYAGLRYNRAYFTGHILSKNRNINNNSQKLIASWLELIIGSETRFFKKSNIYGGCTISLGWLYNFDKFKAIDNYIIPGYGTNANKFTPILNLYIIYKMSFIERMISLT